MRHGRHAGAPDNGTESRLDDDIFPILTDDFEGTDGGIHVGGNNDVIEVKVKIGIE